MVRTSAEIRRPKARGAWLAALAATTCALVASPPLALAEGNDASAKGEGASASADAADSDCPPGFPGCSAPSKSEPETQASSSSPEPARNWLSVAFESDALLLPSAANTCGGGTGYTCFGSGGSYYADAPLAGADDDVGGGLALATSRVLVGYDRAVGRNFTIGARLGYAFGGGPQRPTASSFMPLHAEGRVEYWFGDDPLARSGLRFFVLAAGGIAELDANIPVDVYANIQAYDSQQTQGYKAWKKSGLAFGAAGGGAMYAITPTTGVALEAKAMEMFPTTAPGLALQLAYLVGL